MRSHNHNHDIHGHSAHGHSHSILSRRTLLSLAGATGLAAGLSPLLVGCGNTTPTANDNKGPLKIGYLPITDAAPLLVALREGYYEAEGVDVAAPTLFRGWDAITEAVRTGKVDIAHLLMPTALQLRMIQKAPVKVIAWNHMNGSALTVATDGRPLAELGGSTIAIPFWYSIHNVSLQILLAKVGLKPIADGQPSSSEVKLVVMAPADMLASLASGAVAGYIVAEPFNAVAEVKEVGRIERFTGDIWKDHACCVLVVNEKLIAESPDLVQRTIRAVAKAQLFCESDRSAAAGLLTSGSRPLLPQAAPAVERVFTHYDVPEYIDSGAIQHPEWGIDRVNFQPFPFASFTEELVVRLRTTLVQPSSKFLDDVDPAEVHKDLVHDAFARQAIADLGGAAKFGIPESFTRTELISA
ncbi:MAG: ABC transporter substrate-binding protein [Microthrixaceae bacterium]|nr:ABC transporter substrate-binding protein [Microthrixaceae bacterium]